MNPETAHQRRIMLAHSRDDTRLFRNNVGVATYPDGEKVAYGLCPGSSDLIGWRTVAVTPDMVGKRVAVFAAIEAKTESGRLTLKQRNFLDAVRAAGGIAGVARTVEEAAEVLRQGQP